MKPLAFSEIGCFFWPCLDFDEPRFWEQGIISGNGKAILNGTPAKKSKIWYDDKARFARGESGSSIGLPPSEAFLPFCNVGPVAVNDGKRLHACMMCDVVLAG